jgi:hypothetical protein
MGGSDSGSRLNFVFALRGRRRHFLYQFQPRRSRQRAAALLQPADILGLSHLQPIQWLMLSLRRNDVRILCSLGGLWGPLIDQSSDFIFLFGDGA